MAPIVLDTTAGEMPLEEMRVDIGDRTWSILHGGAPLSKEDEKDFIRTQNATKRPYGAVVWPASIALAHDLWARDLAGKRILEIGAGTGLPGIVAAARGARVVQTDRQSLALHVCEQNAARNQVTTIEYRVADWTRWTDREQYDFVIGSDILYTDLLHPFIKNIFDTNLAPGGLGLLADPFREQSMSLFDLMEADGWNVTVDKWTVGTASPPRPIGVYALTRVELPGA